MSLIGTKLLIFKRDGVCSGAYETKEKSLTIGGDINCDIRLKIPEVDAYICKIALDEYGRAKLTNLCGKDVFVNEIAVEQKIILKDGDMINILNKRFQWKDERKSKTRKTDSTPTNSRNVPSAIDMTASVPTKSRRSVKSTIHSIISKFSKRITVDSFKPSTANDQPHEGTIAESSSLKTYSTDVLENELPVKRNKENLTPSKNIQSNLNKSGTMIVSFSPVATPASEHYGTPTSILSEINDSSFVSLDGTFTNSPQKHNSSMYLIDLTTPAPPEVQKSKSSPSSSKNILKKMYSVPNTPISTTKNNLLRSALKNLTTELTKNSAKQGESTIDTDVNLSGISRICNTKNDLDNDSSFKATPNDVSPKRSFSECCAKDVTAQENQILVENKEQNWIKSLIDSNKDTNEHIKPNSKSQILSERYSNITPEISNISNSTTGQSSLLLDASKILSLSPVSKTMVSFNKTTEHTEMFSIDDTLISNNIRSSLRSTRKQINRALTSLNKSKSTETLEVQDDSIVNATEIDVFENSEVEKHRIITSLDKPENLNVTKPLEVTKALVVPDVTKHIEVNTDNDTIAIIETPKRMARLSHSTPMTYSKSSKNQVLANYESKVADELFDALKYDPLGACFELDTPDHQTTQNISCKTPETKMKGKLLRSDLKESFTGEVTTKEEVFANMKHGPIDTNSEFKTPDRKNTRATSSRTPRTETKAISLRSDFKEALAAEVTAKKEELFANMKHGPIDANLEFKTPDQKITRTTSSKTPRTQVKATSLRSDFKEALIAEVTAKKEEVFANMKDGPIDATSEFKTPDQKLTRATSSKTPRTQVKATSLRSDFKEALIAEVTAKKEEVFANMKDGPIDATSEFKTPDQKLTRATSSKTPRTQVKTTSLRSDFKEALTAEVTAKKEEVFANMKDGPIDPSSEFKTPEQKITRATSSKTPRTQVKATSLRSDFKEALTAEVTAKKEEVFANMKDGPIDASSKFKTPDQKITRATSSKTSRTQVKATSLRSDFKEALTAEITAKKEEVFANMKDGPIDASSEFKTPDQKITRATSSKTPRTQVKATSLRSDFKEALTAEITAKKEEVFANMKDGPIDASSEFKTPDQKITRATSSKTFRTQVKAASLRSDFKEVLTAEITAKKEEVFANMKDGPIDATSEFKTPDQKLTRATSSKTPRTQVKATSLRSDFKEALTAEVTAKKEEVFANMKDGPIDATSEFKTPDQKLTRATSSKTPRTQVKATSLRSDFKEALTAEITAKKEEVFANMKDGPIDANSKFKTPDQKTTRATSSKTSRTQVKATSLRSDFKEALTAEVTAKKEEVFANMKDGPIDANSKFKTPDQKITRATSSKTSRTQVKATSLRSDFKKSLASEVIKEDCRVLNALPSESHNVDFISNTDLQKQIDSNQQEVNEENYSEEIHRSVRKSKKRKLYTPSNDVEIENSQIVEIDVPQKQNQYPLSETPLGKPVRKTKRGRKPATQVEPNLVEDNINITSRKVGVRQKKTNQAKDLDNDDVLSVVKEQQSVVEPIAVTRPRRANLKKINYAESSTPGKQQDIKTKKDSEKSLKGSEPHEIEPENQKMNEKSNDAVKSPPKKGRGRKKKNEPENKTVDEKSDGTFEPLPNKGRGKKRKIELENQIADEKSDDKLDSPPNKGRGRKKKVELENQTVDEKSDGKSHSSPKKSRGRKAVEKRDNIDVDIAPSKSSKALRSRKAGIKSQSDDLDAIETTNQKTEKALGRKLDKQDQAKETLKTVVGQKHVDTEDISLDKSLIQNEKRDNAMDKPSDDLSNVSQNKRTRGAKTISLNKNTEVSQSIEPTKKRLRKNSSKVSIKESENIEPLPKKIRTRKHIETNEEVKEPSVATRQTRARK